MIKPPIWRGIIVREDITLDRLHDIIQIAMGWKQMHLHEFVIDGKKYTEDPEDPEFDGQDESGVTLMSAMGSEVERFAYTYDFGDQWTHTVEVEGPSDATPPLAICTDGQRACPPEDFGGIGVYAEMLAHLRKK